MFHALGAWEYSSATAETGVSFRLVVDHIQGDAYAPPRKLQLRVPHAVARFPLSLYENRVRCVRGCGVSTSHRSLFGRRTALCDYIAREVCARLERILVQARASGPGGWAGEKGGEVSVDRPGQEVLERIVWFLPPRRRGMRKEGWS